MVKIQIYSTSLHRLTNSNIEGVRPNDIGGLEKSFVNKAGGWTAKGAKGRLQVLKSGLLETVSRAEAIQEGQRASMH